MRKEPAGMSTISADTPAAVPISLRAAISNSIARALRTRKVLPLIFVLACFHEFGHLSYTIAHA